MDLNHPKICGHKGPVLDVQWNPFDDNEIASASEDCTIKIWTIPDGGLTANLEVSKADLKGHGKKVQESYLSTHHKLRLNNFSAMKFEINNCNSLCLQTYCIAGNFRIVEHHHFPGTIGSTSLS